MSWVEGALVGLLAMLSVGAAPSHWHVGEGVVD